VLDAGGALPSGRSCGRPLCSPVGPSGCRASHVEPDAEGCWWADMGPSGGAVLGPYGSRSEALGAEREWLMAAGKGLK